MKKIKKIYKSKIGGWHSFTCDICSEMLKRGYVSEARYWHDVSADKLKPVKYKLVRYIK